MSKNILELKRKRTEANSIAREECTMRRRKANKCQQNVQRWKMDGVIVIKWVYQQYCEEEEMKKGSGVSNRLVHSEKRSKGKAVSGNFSSECFSSVIKYKGTHQYYNSSSERAFF